MEETGQIRSITRALKIIKAFTDESEMSLTAISNKVGLSKPTTHRILSTLEAEGFVRRRDDLQYRLGMLLIQLGAAATKGVSLLTISEPYLRKLNTEINETVSLNVVIDGKRLCIFKLDSTHPLRDFIEVDKLLPVHRGASGKALLAFLPESEQQRIIAAIDDPHLNKERLMRQLEEIRQMGYAYSKNDRVDGAAAIAAPIFDKTGRMIASLGLSGAAGRFTNEKKAPFEELVLQTAAAITNSLTEAAFTMNG